MAKKQISLDQLEVGIYIEADFKEGASRKNVLLLGKGMLITSANQIHYQEYKEMGSGAGACDCSGR